MLLSEPFWLHNSVYYSSNPGCVFFNLKWLNHWNQSTIVNEPFKLYSSAWIHIWATKKVVSVTYVVSVEFAHHLLLLTCIEYYKVLDYVVNKGKNGFASFLISLCKIHVNFEYVIILCSKFELKQYLKLFIKHYTLLNFGLYKAHWGLKHIRF